MKLDLEQLKTLVDGGDKTAVEAYVKTAIEKTDMDALVSINNDVRSYVDSAKDKHHETALQTYKEKEVPKLIDAAVKEATKGAELTDEQKRIAALEQQVAESQAKEAQALLRAELTPLATEAKIPTKVLDLIVQAGDDAKDLFEAVKAEQESTLKALVDDAFKGAGRQPGADGGGGGTTGSFGEELAKTTNAQQASIEAQSHYF